jgi:hypothetical protein
MEGHRIPGWLAPIIGPIAGVAIAFRGVLRGQGTPSAEFVAAFAVAGFIGGLVVWLMDRHSQAHTRAVDDLLSRLPPEGHGDGEARPPRF